MARPLVLIDCDGVLADFDSAILKIANEKTGRSWTVSDIKSWEVFENLQDPAHPDLRSFCYGLANQPGWCASLDPYDHAKHAMERLRKKAEVLVVTAPFSGLTWEGERRAWLRDHFSFTKAEIVQTSSKWAVHGDFLIDDRFENCDHWSRYYRCGGTAILWDPHGRNARPLTPRMTRASNWEQIFELVGV